MATISYTKYAFRNPPPINENEYNILKNILTSNPKYNLNPPSSFFENFKMYLILIGIGAVSLSIALLDIANVINWITGIIAFIGIGQLLSFIPSLFSYLEYLGDKKSYYSNLREDINKSKDYSEFLAFRKGKR